MMDSGMIIGLKKKEHNYKMIVKKLLNKEQLGNDEKEFLKKENVI